MNRSFERLVRPSVGLLAVALVCLLPSLARAENVVFRNDCRSSVVVQTAVVVKGVVQKDQPVLLRPGDTTDKIPTDMDRIVTVYDARSNKMLFRDVLKADPKNPRAYAILPDPQVMNKVRLVQRKVK